MTTPESTDAERAAMCADGCAEKELGGSECGRQCETADGVMVGRKCLYCAADMIPGSECLNKAQSESCDMRAGVAVPVPAGPLRELGAYLSRVLDEDQWATAEAMLLRATGVAVPQNDLDPSRNKYGRTDERQEAA